MQDYEIAAQELAAKITEMRLTVKCRFVPFSQSRNAAESTPSLNWKCDVFRGDHRILSDIDYMQGSGHCPAYKAGGKRFPIKADLQRAIALECQSGRRAALGMSGRPYATAADITPPTAADIIASLAQDSDVIDFGRFEEWACEFGYDTDSRKAEAIYRACLGTALQLRAAIGDSSLAELRGLAGRL